MIMIVFSLALLAAPPAAAISQYMQSPNVGCEYAGVSTISLDICRIAENARVPVDNPANHLELTMCARSHGAGIFGAASGHERNWRFDQVLGVQSLIAPAVPAL